MKPKKTFVTGDGCGCSIVVRNEGSRRQLRMGEGPGGLKGSRHQQKDGTVDSHIRTDKPPQEK